MGGAEYQAKLLVERLLALNLFEVHYAARNVCPMYRPDGYSIQQIAPRRRFAGAFFSDAPALWRLLKRLKPDIVYQRVGCAYTGVAAHYARSFRRRMVWHVSSDRDVMPMGWRRARRRPLQGVDKLLLEYGARRADAVIVQSRVQGELLQHHYARSPTAQIGNFHPVPSQIVAKDTDVLRVCWIASMKPLKRPEIFLRLAQDLRDQPGVEFVMAGAPPAQPERCRQLQAQISDTANLRCLGLQSTEAVNDLLARSHLLVNTSEYEGFSNTFIQAWLREVPVLSLLVNPDGVFDGGRLGFCADGHYEELLSSVRRCIRDQELRTAVGRRARRHAEENFAEGNVDRLIRVLADG